MVEVYLPGKGMQRLEDILNGTSTKEEPVEEVKEHAKQDEDDEVPLPNTCDVKEQLIEKLQELDHKIYMLIKSNKVIAEDLADDPEVGNYISENEGIIMKTKDEIIRILVAFLKVGIDIDKDEVLSKMQHRHLYMPPEDDKKVVQEEPEEVYL